ncbi:MAG: glutamate 5-kinase [Clostridia bacterium]|nr:glutamate 5-kinase [Clostridia bacterium]MBQ6613697.1 glutamate 5-kinase [Clostridia bacterium]
MSTAKDYRRIVVKIGTSTMTHDTGKLNLHRIETLARVLSDIKNSGREVILVSSGAVSAGVARIGFHRPTSTKEKQALAAIGQSEIMQIYSKFFSMYGHPVAQLLLTKDVVDNPVRRDAAEATLEELLAMGCVPVINENDSVSCYEIEFGGNDRLSACVGVICHADIVINLTDIDGYYDSDPRVNPDAKLISRVERVTDEMVENAGGAGTARGTGGMQAKLLAAQMTAAAGIPMMIVNGTDPEILYNVMDGTAKGTFFEGNI